MIDRRNPGILTRIGGIDFSYALEALAQAFQTLAPKLTPEQAHKASDGAKTLLAWAASDKEAAEWARALVTLLDRTGDPDKTNKLVAAVAYPAAAEAATDILLDAIRAQAPDGSRSGMACENVPRRSSPSALPAAAAIRPEMSPFNSPARLRRSWG